MTTQDLKSEIKKLSAQQRETKEQRKTVKFKGIRKMSPQEAQWKSINQGDELKHMFIAYALLRHKPIEKTIGPKTEYSQKRVDYLVERYGEAVRTREDGPQGV